jgi:two-component system sensor histidine kinase KdpD
MNTKYGETRTFDIFDYNLLRILLSRRNRSNRNAIPSVRNFIEQVGFLRSITGYGVGLATVLLITLFFRTGMQVNATTAGFTFLIAILSASTLWGLGVSAMMSVAATLAFDYFFLPPVGSLDIADPQDWIALFSFLVTAVLGSSLSARAHNRAAEADRRSQELQRLYALSQRLLGEASLMELTHSIPQHIVESFGADSAAIFLSGGQEIHRAGIERPHLSDDFLRLAAAGDEVKAVDQSNVWFTPLKSGLSVIGSVGISGPAISQGIIGALGCLVAASLERAGAVEDVAKMQAARESEQFKSILLDAITHDFRTPLTGIKTSVSALLTDLEFESEQKNELLTIIDEECDRIDQLLDKASVTARLQSGEVELRPKSQTIHELISTALSECKAVSHVRPIHCDVPHKESRVMADLPLASSVLVQLIVNAHLYSSPGQPIMISTEEGDGCVFFRVSDHGPGIEKNETARIFERFYRCGNGGVRAHGTGMGLPIAKAIVEAHGGKIEVVSGTGCGSVFTFSLPLDLRATANV